MTAAATSITSWNAVPPSREPTDKRRVFGAVEAQVAAEQQKARGAPGDLVDDLRQINEIVLLHLDQPQALLGVLVQQAFDDGRFAGAARAGEEHVVRRLRLHELARILLDALDLLVDAAQVRKLDAMHLTHRVQP